MPSFLETVNGTQVVIGLYIASLSVLAIVYVGFNRLSAIPLIVSLTNCLGSFLGYWNWTPDSTTGLLRVNTASLFFNYVGFFAGELILVMYGYFIVERLLPRAGAGGPYSGIMSRKTFMWIFWPLQTIHAVTRVGSLIYAIVAYRQTGSPDATKPLYDLVQIQFVELAVIECFTAYVLINIFRVSRRTSIRFLGGKRIGLLKHMLLSTEIRVASLASLAIFRAALEQPKRYNYDIRQIDIIAVDLLNLFPMLLVTDVILRKAMKMEVDLQGRIEVCKCSEIGGSDKIQIAPDIHRLASNDTIQVSSLTQSPKEKSALEVIGVTRTLSA